MFISKRYISITVFPSRAALKPISHAQHDWFAKKTETHFSLCILVKRKTLHFTHDAFVCRKGANWFDAVLRCTVGILLCLHWILFTNGKQIKRKFHEKLIYWSNEFAAMCWFDVWNRSEKTKPFRCASKHNAFDYLHATVQCEFGVRLCAAAHIKFIIAGDFNR